MGFVTCADYTKVMKPEDFPKYGLMTPSEEIEVDDSPLTLETDEMIALPSGGRFSSPRRAGARSVGTSLDSQLLDGLNTDISSLSYMQRNEVTLTKTRNDDEKTL